MHDEVSSQFDGSQRFGAQRKRNSLDNIRLALAIITKENIQTRVHIKRKRFEISKLMRKNS
jgi:hypothetical protein